MISRTSCAQRQATPNLAAHFSAAACDGTSIITNPPMTALISGNGPSETVSSVATMLAFCLSTPPPRTPHPSLLRGSDDRVSCLTHGFQFLLRELHRAIVERDQVPRHPKTPLSDVFTAGPHGACEAREDRAVQVFVAGDDEAAKNVVHDIVAKGGFELVEFGPLSNARYLEPVREINIHLGFFLGWGTSAAPAWIKA